MKHSDRIDMRFRYVSAAATDIRKTIKRERERLKALKEEQEKAEREAVEKVIKIGEKK